ncbi:GNAT family N-acetyltransferase [Paenibacillus sp. HJGM_3]|uniref:GNAT family N-acetyltransferase n=1 Tax=Paenibacillus sp. HJGM_3 TaxID=3379816 RepID=UPI00385A3CB3
MSFAAAFLDRLAATTWPALHTQPMESWLLRAHPALPSRRSSSVLAVGSYPSGENWLPAIEAFYQEYRLPVRFHVSDASPDDLDDCLEQLGYTVEMATEVMTAGIETIATSLYSSAQLEAYYICTREAEASDSWLDAYMEIEQFRPELRPAYAQMMARIGGDKRFLQLRHPENREPVAVGTAILHGEWAGLINIATAAAYRSQGIGSQMVRYLTDACRQQGVKQLYLQVLATNEVAKRLYRRAGFERVYGYHYRTKTQEAP